MWKIFIYLVFFSLVLSSVDKAQEFDSDVIFRVSKAISEWKLMNDSEEELIGPIFALDRSGCPGRKPGGFGGHLSTLSL